jgi:hypothetical protein
MCVKQLHVQSANTNHKRLPGRLPDSSVAAPPHRPVVPCVRVLRWRSLTSCRLVGITIQVQISDTCRIYNPMDIGMRTIFYLRMAPVPESNRDGYGTDIFSHPRVIRRVPDTLLPL